MPIQDFKLSGSLAQTLLRLVGALLLLASLLALAVGTSLFFGQGRENGWDLGEDTEAAVLILLTAAVPAALAWLLLRIARSRNGRK